MDVWEKEMTKTYEQWLNDFHYGEFYYEPTIEHFVGEMEKVGINIDTKSVGFDLYYNDISMDGGISPQAFAKAHPKLMEYSLVRYQLLIEKFDTVLFGRSRSYRSHIGFSFSDYNSFMGVWDESGEYADTFAEGLFAGCNIQELLMADPYSDDDFLEDIATIIRGYMDDLLRTLKDEYEYYIQPEVRESLLQADGDRVQNV
jgi:hypothetical protein